jgi:hypothetical protein
MAKSCAKGGFMLFEALVALTIALICIIGLNLGFNIAWNRSHRPSEALIASEIGLKAADDIRANRDSKLRDVSPFSYRIIPEPLAMDIRPSQLPPAVKLTQVAAASDDTPVQGMLEKVSIIITAPSGREYRYETITLRFAKK